MKSNPKEVRGVSILALAAYVGYNSIKSLPTRELPERSIPGVLLAVASLIIMPLLSRAKRKVAMAIKSGALAADAKQTELCTYLSAILLSGLLLNVLLGWWWADPLRRCAARPAAMLMTATDCLRLYDYPPD